MKSLLRHIGLLIIVAIMALSLSTCDELTEENKKINAQIPIINTQPSNAMIIFNTSHILSVSAVITDGGTLSYQWYSNSSASNSGGTTITGATSAVYNPPTSTAGTFYYFVEITNTIANNGDGGTKTATVRSNAVTLTVNARVNAQTPNIISQPVGGTVISGDSHSFTVTANSPDDGAISYQWYSNTIAYNTSGTPITGATLAIYNPPTSTTGTYYYFVEITNTIANNGDGGTKTATVRSNAVTLIVALPITSADITITAPVTGETPSTESTGAGNFTRGNVTWSPAHSPFQGGQVYTSSITLTANSGYTFMGLTTANIDGIAAAVSNNTGTMVTLTRAFPETARIPITSVTITGVTAPVTGVTPSTASSGTGNFTRGNVTWSPIHSPFQGGQVYTASITLTANSGYTFTGLTTATINGSTATISNNTGATVTLTRVFVIELMWINSGTFQMDGSDSGGTSRSVTLTNGFYMGKYEVTQAQYKAVMNNANPSYFGGDNLPVETVRWYDAIVFCNRLSIMEGLTPAYRINGNTNPDDWGTVPTSSNATWDAVEIEADSTGYRLPTEAQWEYACRAGTTTAFNWGSNIINSTQANYDARNVDTYNTVAGTYIGRTTEVGSYAPNAWGLYDMHGNVSEWCWDWYGSYVSGAQTDPRGALSGSFRVLRGGSWDYDGQNLRSANRGYSNPDYGYGSIGFRLLRP